MNEFNQKFPKIDTKFITTKPIQITHNYFYKYKILTKNQSYCLVEELLFNNLLWPATYILLDDPMISVNANLIKNVSHSIIILFI